MYSFRNSGTTVAIAITYDVPFSACSVYDGTNGTFYLNGNGSASVASSGTFVITTYQIGNSLTEEAASNFYGYIGEIIIFNRYLGKTERQLIEGYLAQKWGLKSYLPSTHSFKIEVPLTPRFDILKFVPNLWLDALDTSTITTAGTYISQWNDKSGNNYHFDRGTSSNNAGLVYDNGYPGVYFNGNQTNQFQGPGGLLGSTTWTIFMIFNMDVSVPSNSGTHLS